ncbi:Wzy polymerase domain-containing protein [uncultured Pseudacidovorax sp.]|uniref:PglL family O-oligosaccharyltransferase n=1 Tax=uncultured Pseudacidovorax sp. TaxID=679313 RepID=UPI0025D25EDE|nr:Wzy polymerase domain-containing protein [uncultured Pseudacidovorax sp.]
MPSDLSEVSIWAPTVASLALMGLAADIGASAASAHRRPACSLAFAQGLLAAGLFSALLGLIQYHGLAAPLRPWVAVPMEPIGMAYGNLRQRNQFATLLSMALVALLWCHGQAGVRGRRLLLGAGALLVAGLAVSTSRTGLLQLLVIVMAAGGLGWRERRPAGRGGGVPPHARPRLLPDPRWMLVALGLYALLSWMLPWSAVAVASMRAADGGAGADIQGMLIRLREGAPPGHSRVLLWSNVLWLIGQRPWTGWGWGQLSVAHYLAEYPGPRFVEILDNAHNLPLHLAVELGIPAAVLICGAFLWMVVAARPWQERDPARLMVWGVLGMIVMHSLVEYPLWYGPFQLVFGLCLGLIWSGRKPALAKQTSGRSSLAAAQRSEARARLGARLTAAALVAMVAYVGWSYVRVSQPFLPAAERLAGWRDDPLAQLDPDGRDRPFARQVRFAQLALTPLTPDTAARVHELAQATLAFSPEPRVVVKLIDSARLLGLEQEAQFHLERLRVVYPEAYARWLAGKPPA